MKPSERSRTGDNETPTREATEELLAERRRARAILLMYSPSKIMSGAKIRGIVGRFLY